MLKKLLSTSLILVLICSVPLSSISAESTSENSIAPTLYANGNVEEKEIVIDASHIESKPANLIADFDSDFNELVAQLIKQYPDTQLLKSQFESGKSSSELKRIELQAKELLKSRYEDNNKSLRPEILAAAESNKMQFDTLALDVVWYESGDRTRTTGNYGSTSGDASYTAAANNNRAKVYAYALVNTTSQATSGWQFAAGIGYPNEKFVADINFRYVTFKGSVSCPNIDIAAATIEASTFIYDATASSIVGSRGLVDYTSCTGYSVGYVDSGPTSLTYTGVQLRNSHIYNAYIQTDAISAVGGVANAKTNTDYGAKWEFIEVINARNPSP